MAAITQTKRAGKIKYIGFQFLTGNILLEGCLVGEVYLITEIDSMVIVGGTISICVCQLFWLLFEI